MPLVMVTLLFISGCVQLEETTLSLDSNNGIGDFQEWACFIRVNHVAEVSWLQGCLP